MEKLGELLVGDEQERLQLRELEVKFLKDQKSILKQIMLCKKSGGLLGVYSLAFGQGMFLTTVEDIDFKVDDTLISFKPYDMNGTFIKKSTISVKNISGICPFNQIYIEPRAFEKQIEVLVD